MPGIWTSRGSSSTAGPGWVAGDALNAVAGRRLATRGQPTGPDPHPIASTPTLAP